MPSLIGRRHGEKTHFSRNEKRPLSLSQVISVVFLGQESVTLAVPSALPIRIFPSLSEHDERIVFRQRGARSRANLHRSCLGF